MQMKENVVELTEKVNTKLDEVKSKMLDESFNDEDLLNFENEIEDVEEKLDEYIEEIKD